MLDSVPRRGVAQSGSAPVWGTGGRRFKSGRPDQIPSTEWTPRRVESVRPWPPIGRSDPRPRPRRRARPASDAHRRRRPAPGGSIRGRLISSGRVARRRASWDGTGRVQAVPMTTGPSGNSRRPATGCTVRIDLMRDLYADLHVPPSATRDAMHASFRSLARHWHPDFGGDSARMQVINDAWAVLGRPDRRATYDQQRATERVARQHPATAKATQPTMPTPEPAVRPQQRDPNALDYGRYEGWTIEALGDHDPDYLEWLRRSPSGRSWRSRIDAVLTARAMRTTPPPAPPKRRGRFGR